MQKPLKTGTRPTQNLLRLLAAFDTAGGQLPELGQPQFATRYKGELFAEYPEIEIIGFSFNTTILGWGVQGDFAYRDGNAFAA